MDNTQTTYHTAGPAIGPSNDDPTSATGAGRVSKFRRSREHKLLGGVCGGLAQTLGLDVALVRVLAVVLAIVTNGLGALAYLTVWLIIPEEGTETTVLPAMLRR